jgi:hypothetical protein
MSVLNSSSAVKNGEKDSIGILDKLQTITTPESSKIAELICDETF